MFNILQETKSGLCLGKQDGRVFLLQVFIPVVIPGGAVSVCLHVSLHVALQRKSFSAFDALKGFLTYKKEKKKNVAVN